MKKQQITTRQMLVLLFAGMLSPTIRVLPQRSVAVGGTVGWLSSLTALVPALLVVWAVLTCLRRLPKESGFGELLTAGFGRVGGRVAAGVYAAWSLLAVAVFLRLYSERFLSTTYAHSSIYLFLVAILVLTLWNNWGSLGAFARMGQIFFFVLIATLALVLGLTAGEVKAERVFPLWWQDLPDLLRATGPAMAPLSYGIFTFFLGGSVKELPQHRGTVLRWTAGFGILLTVMQFITLGVFGAPMVARMQVPFFMLAKEINIYGALERFESIIIALWVITDVVLAGLMVRTARTALQFAFDLPEGRTIAVPMILGLLPAAMLIAANQFALEDFCVTILSHGNLILGYAAPLAACALMWVKRRRGAVA